MATLSSLEKMSPTQSIYDVKDQLRNFVYAESEKCFDAGDRARDGLRTKRDVERRIAAIRQAFTDAIGGLPSSDTPLKPKVVDAVECDGYRIEKIIIHPRPHVHVTTNLYLPHGLKKPSGAVLFLCGHCGFGKHGDYQLVCQRLVQAGLIVLAQDPVGQGERHSYYEPSLGKPTIPCCCAEHDHAGSQCLMAGDSLARYFVHDAIRSVDYLASRPEVDPTRIGVTGTSGGGTQTSMLMMLEPRLAAAAPSCFIMNRRTYMRSGGAQDAEQIWPGMTQAGFDHEDILIAMAPKPVIVLAAKQDFFPIEGTRETVARSRRVWDIFGKREYLNLVEDDSPHKYTDSNARAAAAFLARHLNGTRKTVTGPAPKLLPQQSLWCTTSGQIQGEIPAAAFVFEENLQRLKEARKRSANSPLKKCRQDAVKWLRDKIHNSRKPCDLNPRFYLNDNVEDLLARGCFWWSQDGLINHGVFFRHFSKEKEKLPCVVAVWDQGTNRLAERVDWLRKTCESGACVLVLDVSGVGALTPHPLLAGTEDQEFYGVIHKLNDDLLWLGDSLCALRTYDVIRCVDLLNAAADIDSARVTLRLEGRQGVYGYLASLLDKRIQGVDADRKPAEYFSWVGKRHYSAHGIRSVILPGIMRHADALSN